jgi:uncharacterized protein (TIGR00369 family)
MADPDLDAVPPERISGFNRHLGMDRIRRGAGRAEIEVEVRPEFTNRRGASHGGLILSLLDSALGSAVVSAIAPEEWCGTVQLNVQFLAPGRGRLIGRGWMVKRGRHVAFARGEVVDAAGSQVATAEGTWYVWPSHPDRRGE